MSYALWAKRKVNCNIAGTLDLSRAEFSLTEPIPLQAENRERKTVLEAKYLEQADQWVPASQFAIQYI